MDGWIRIWFYETIDQANSHNEEHFLEIQPIYEYHISESDGADSMLMCICKQEPNNPESTFWYAQVSNTFPVTHYNIKYSKRLILMLANLI